MIYMFVFSFRDMFETIDFKADKKKIYKKFSLIPQVHEKTVNNYTTIFILWGMMRKGKAYNLFWLDFMFLV
jgi:hypothetical protein